jgi:MFS family permease
MKSSVLAPFSIRSFRFQWPADLAASWAFEMEMLILGWYVLVESGSVVLLVVFASLQYVGALISPFIGVLGDRLGYKRMFVGIRVILVLLSLILLWLAVLDVLTPTLVIFLAFVGGILKPSDIMIRFALIGQTLAPAQLVAALGISRMSVDSARMFGALAGVGLFAAFGLVVAYVMIVTMYVVCLIFSLGVAGREPRAPSEATSLATPLQDLKQGFAYVVSKPELLGSTSLAFWVNLFAYPLCLGLLPYIVNNVYEAGQALLGLMGGAYAFGALLGSIVVSSNRIAMGAGRLMIVAALCWFAIGLVFGFNQNSHLGVALMVLIGFVQSLCVTPLVAVMLKTSDPSYRGRVMGIRILAILGLPAGLLIAGSLIELIGFSWTIAIFSLCGMACAAAMTVIWKDKLWSKTAIANQGQPN